MIDNEEKSLKYIKIIPPPLWLFSIENFSKNCPCKSQKYNLIITKNEKLFCTNCVDNFNNPTRE